MADQSSRTVICSVAFLDIVEYSKRPVTEQIAIKGEFNQLIAEAIKDIAPNDRILVDSGDGVALCFLGDPEDALFVAINLRDQVRKQGGAKPALEVRFGINLGPVRLVKDINDRPNVLGDGINDAQRVMSFAKPNQILVSRSYFEVVSRLSQEYMNLFHYCGSRTDKHVREHEVYEVEVPEAQGGKTDNLPVGVKTEINIPKYEEVAAAATQSPATSPRKNMLMYGAIGAAVVLAGALALTMGGKKEQQAAHPVAAEQRQEAAPPQAATTVEKAPETAKKNDPATKTKTAESKTHAPAQQDKAVKTAPVAKGKSGDSKQNGTLTLAITPWGDVFINGKKRGTSPPLNQLQLPPGKHDIEIRSQEGLPYISTVEVKPGANTRITHRFY